MVLSGSEPSDDQFSSDGDENNDQDGTLIGDNPYNLIDLSMEAVYHWRSTNKVTRQMNCLILCNARCNFFSFCFGF
ncbi:hypothetical protein AHAS_Ahas03G0275700 [Arachis hypogaea]